MKQRNGLSALREHAKMQSQLEWSSHLCDHTLAAFWTPTAPSLVSDGGYGFDRRDPGVPISQDNERSITLYKKD
jgi:hypothetical protein